MSHQWANSLQGAWYDGFVVPGADMSSLDGKLAALINGDGGGTWAPIQVIYIRGAGVGVLGPWTMGGTAFAQSTPSKPFTLGDSDFFDLAVGHTSRSRTLMSSCLDMLATITRSDPVVISGIGWKKLSGNGIEVVPTLGSAFGSPSGTQAFVPANMVIPVRVHNGATLASATLTWNVGQSHSAIPENTPKWRIVSISSSGKLTPLNTTFTGSYDAEGFLLMATPASAAAYYNSGSLYTPTYTCDAGVVIDTSVNEYAVEIVDEWGPTNSLMGNTYYEVALSFTTIVDMRFQT